jgi:hypothetical protein
VAVVKAGNGYVVGDISGWIPGAFQKMENSHLACPRALLVVIGAI